MNKQSNLGVYMVKNTRSKCVTIKYNQVTASLSSLFQCERSSLVPYSIQY